MPGEIRLRKYLGEPIAVGVLPDGYHLKPFEDADAPALHALLVEVFEDQDRNFERWWNWLSSDAEYDPALVFLAVDDHRRLAAAAQCWASGYVKDLVTAEFARGQGLGETLMLLTFAAFKPRGIGHVDLKTSTIISTVAVRLYKRLGMVEVDWGG